MTSLFDDALFTELKTRSVEELLVKCIEIIDSLYFSYISDYKVLHSIKNKIKDKLQNLLLLMSELYRREIADNLISIIQHINTFYEDDKCLMCKEQKNLDYYFVNSCVKVSGKYYGFSPLICSICKVKYSNEIRLPKERGMSQIVYEAIEKNKIEVLTDGLNGRQICIYNTITRLIIELKESFENKLQEIQMVKETMLRIMKTPLLTKELEECMDEILDLNGNRISQLKEYLTEDQYRFVRSGAKFEELDDQQDMLNRMNKMLKQLKMTSIGQSLLDLPIARPITPEIKHLERELESHNFRQKKHEKELEKLKRKI
jgi:hypothetical protein